MNTDELASKACRDEYSAYLLYSTLSRNPLIPGIHRDILVKASRDEYRHYVFWRSIVGDCAERTSRLKTILYTHILLFFGLTAVFKLIEKMETSTRINYDYMVSRHPELRVEIENLINEEKKHEEDFIRGIEEDRVKYLSSIALGISDALIELTGVYTGSLGVFNRPLSSGLIGLIAGLSASISMGIASYTQAKHSGFLDPVKSAVYTMSAYFTVAVLLAIPFFVFDAPLIALITMLSTALMVITYLSLYATIISDKKFSREFAENTVLLLGVSLALYFVGNIIRSVLGIQVE